MDAIFKMNSIKEMRSTLVSTMNGERANKCLEFLSTDSHTPRESVVFRLAWVLSDLRPDSAFQLKRAVLYLHQHANCDVARLVSRDPRLISRHLSLAQCRDLVVDVKNFGTEWLNEQLKALMDETLSQEQRDRIQNRVTWISAFHDDEATSWGAIETLLNQVIKWHECGSNNEVKLFPKDWDQVLKQLESKTLSNPELMVALRRILIYVDYPSQRG